ncbi:MAG: bifunctional DNA-formamidopyrimidine glycosylase/DNA-(apurinic or apyrimidinic site) lyase [Candidatus Heimdallarchaeota archaeon]|nr:MAG: bifunctional DNA-formamidopyrimidine glycosylase/DNA-(apurinic or apyrimidinic site) lyase [Candidatus Heimdallarchaeota archaeon]
MPEGPEVETVRLELLQLISKKVDSIQLTPLSQKYPKYEGKQPFFNQFSRKTIHSIDRFGKFLVWRFTNVEAVILNHLGMTGRWCLYKDLKKLPTTTKHIKVIIHMKSPPNALFNDIRNFGQFKVFQSFEEVQQYTPIRSLGVDGLTTPFPLNEFLTRLAKKNFKDKPIGEVLLNQRLVAGVGNIYKTESLFHAKINPLKKVKKLSNTEREELGLAIGKILQKALHDKGSTMEFQPYELPSGTTGNAQKWHKVYKREGKPCLECGTPITRMIQKDRSTFYCLQCQK